MKLFFTDIFEIDDEILQNYGAFNVSLKERLPLYIDPMLIFYSQEQSHKELYLKITQYFEFLLSLSNRNWLTKEQVEEFYSFKHIHQNWFEYSKKGSLGKKFIEAAVALNQHPYYFEKSHLTQHQHIVKFALFSDSISNRDIANLTTQLSLEYLLEYTETFATLHMNENDLNRFTIDKVSFNYETEKWESRSYLLPSYQGDFVLLTPKVFLDFNDIMDKQSLGANRNMFLYAMSTLPKAHDDDFIRKELEDYMEVRRHADPDDFWREHPILAECYLKQRENYHFIPTRSLFNVQSADKLFVKGVKYTIHSLEQMGFYQSSNLVDRMNMLKTVIESSHHLNLFMREYGGNTPSFFLPVPLKQLNTLLRLVWVASDSEGEQSLPFLKSLTGSLKRHLLQNRNKVTGILCQSREERLRVEYLLRDLCLEGSENIILINY